MTTNKENPKNIDKTKTNKSIPINKVNPNTKNKNVKIKTSKKLLVFLWLKF